MTKELARSLLKEKGIEINSIVADSYKKSLFKKQTYEGIEHNASLNIYPHSKKDNYIV